MKTIEQILNMESKCIDGRDIYRVVPFLTEEQMQKLGLEFKEEFKGTHVPIPLTKEAVLEILKKDVAFGFEKALNKRGISAGMMANVVQMWNWILEEGLENFDEYPMYGLPIFKATAIKYGWEDPTTGDTGAEAKYNE